MGGVRLWEGEKKSARGHIMHQNKYFKALRPLVTVLSIKGLLDVALLLYCTEEEQDMVWNCLASLNFKTTKLIFVRLAQKKVQKGKL